MIRKLLCCLVMFAGLGNAHGQSAKDKWIDSVFNSLSQEEKIGQLIMVSAESEGLGLKDVESQIRAFDVGGVFFTKGLVSRGPRTVFDLQSNSKIPLLTALDGASGIQSPYDSLQSFPSLLAQGAISDDHIFNMGKDMGRELSLLGINLHFISGDLVTPDLPLKSSYSDNALIVGSKSLAFMKGLKEANILACAKSFPIRGLKVTAEQKGQPNVVLSVDSIQAFPFKDLIRNDLPALMPASSDFPMFYSKKKSGIANLLTNSSISASFAGDWIRQNMNYNGVIFVDVARMAESGKFGPGEAEVFAFQAGNDVLVLSSNPAPFFRKMKKFLKKEKQYKAQLDRSVRKILAMKFDAGLHLPMTAPDEFIVSRINTRERQVLREKMYEDAVTIVANNKYTLPIRLLEDKTYKVIVADDSLRSQPFIKHLSKFVETRVINVSTDTNMPVLEDPLRPRQVIFVAFFPSTKETTLEKLLPVLESKNPLHEFVICDFGSAAFRPHASKFATVITAYSDEKQMLALVPQIIFGARPASGILPIRFGQIPSGTTHKTQTLQRLGYSFPEAAGMDSRTLQQIEVIAKEAIDMKATPGCHVLVAKDGKVIYEKSFGYLTYENQTRVTDQTIYDLASVTKVSATLQAVMFMHDKSLIDVDKKASFYLPELKTSNKKDFLLKDILTHQAGLWPFLPFWAQTMKDTTYLPEYYSHKSSAQYPFFVSDRLFASVNMKDSLWSWIIKSKIREKPQRTPFDYRYSDMGFYMLQHLAEKTLNQPMEDFLSQNLYEPLGAYRMGYLPLLKFSIHDIAPTENDKLFRRALLIGAVHDQGAAMHGGIAGHAGLFGTATDLAKLGQMLLQEGRYGGTQYYKPETVRFFTQKQFETSRRGLGWDKPTTGDWNGPTSYSASPKTFGHTGFTGTCIWVDPEFKLVYIFLSNRVHPDMTNNKLLTANIRSRIQEVLYQSIFNYCKSTGEELKIPQSIEMQPIGRAQ